MGAPKRILAVDDEHNNLVVLKALVTSLGYKCELARDGFEALALLKPDVDLVLLDVMMPRMDGFEVARRIRVDSDCGDTPIIMVTALTSKGDRLRAVEAGANDFISKPVDKVELQVRMASLLTMKEAQDAIKRHRAELEVTVEKRTAALRESEERVRHLYEESKRREQLYRSVLNSSADAIWVADTEGRTQYVSPSFTRIFGWDIEDVQGTHIPFVPDSEMEAAAALINKVVRLGSQVTSFETTRLTKAGTLLDVSVSSARFQDHNDEPSGLVFVLRDITAFKVLERARKRAVHHLSHELITPIALVEASARRLRDNNLPADAKEKNVARIERNLERLKNIQAAVQEIIVPRSYQPRSFDLTLTVNEIVDDIRAQSDQRLVNIELALEPLETDIIDPVAFGQIVRTLTKNAIENTPDGGQVSISLSKVPSGIQLQVMDSGVGIAVRDREFIFEPFHHTQETAHYSTKSPFDFNAGGKGLELMLLKTLAEGGRFEISFQTQRCRHIRREADSCPGRVSSCSHVTDVEDCNRSGGTTFVVLFYSHGRGCADSAGKSE